MTDLKVCASPIAMLFPNRSTRSPRSWLQAGRARGWGCAVAPRCAFAALARSLFVGRKPSLGLLDLRQVLVGVSPFCQKVVVGLNCLRQIAGQCVGWVLLARLPFFVLVLSFSFGLDA